MANIGYGEFSRAIHGRQAGQRAPLDVSIELTDRCPLQCVQCYNNLPISNKEARSRELSREEHFRLLDELSALGCLWLLYTGGEIFARPDFLEIYQRAKEKGFLITLFTNGTMITDEIANFLCDWPPFAIEITLYGRTRETYEATTGVAGSYERCLRGIEALRSRGLPLKLKTVANSINKHEVLAMKRFAEDELHVPFKFEGILNPRIDSSKAPLAFRLSPAEAVAFDLETSQVAAEYRALAKKDLAEPDVPDDQLYGCAGGVYSFAIDPYGRMSLCVLSHKETYDIRTGSLKEGWEQFISSLRKKTLTRSTRCRTCRIRSLCNMCPALGELENGNGEDAVEFLCEVAHLRAMSFGCDIPAHGPCPYCVGGDRYFDLQDSVQRLTVAKQRTRSSDSAGSVLNARGPESWDACSSCNKVDGV